MADVVDDVITDELARLAAAVDDRTHCDWATLQPDTRGDRFRRRGGLRASVAVGCAIVAVGVPAVAFSSGVRSFLGFRDVRPKYADARVVATARLADGRIARLWASPSTTGGSCTFSTYDEPGATPDPAARSGGGGGCSLIPRQPIGKMTWSFSSGRGRTPAVLDGRVNPTLHAVRVVVNWRGGQHYIRTHDGYFIAGAPELQSPSFTRLPFDLVAVNPQGHQVEVSRIPTSFLYFNWKQVEPKLRTYRRAHGCSKKVVWRCRTR